LLVVRTRYARSHKRAR